MCATHQINQTMDFPLKDRSERKRMMDCLHEDHENLMWIVDKFKSKMTRKEKKDLSQSNYELLIKIKNHFTTLDK